VPRRESSSTRRAPTLVERRSFLRRAGVGVAVVAVGPVLVPVDRFLPAAGAQTGGDPALAAFAESVELVAVAAYEAGVELLSDDLVPVLQTFIGHHEEHAEIWAEVAGEAATGEPNAALLVALTPAIEAFDSQGDVLRFARDLENQLSVTCGYLLTVLQDADAVAAVATIHPVESSHAATLSYELAEGPAAWFPFGALESADVALGLDPAAFPVEPS
jgi:rubrerythrin